MRSIRTSKFLSLVLRHNPETIGITLDAEGWIDVQELLAALERSGRGITYEQLESVVENNDKQRFVIRDGRIRANQGHSLGVSLGLMAKEPPAVLYHGTATRFLESIKENGLIRKQRQHVHLSSDVETASKVGVRHGKLLVLRVQAAEMHRDGREFFFSENGVWLTQAVPWDFLEIIEDAM